MNANSRLLVFLVFLVTLGGAPAARADAKVAEEVESGGESFSGVDYAISDHFDRAWLVLHFTETGPCPTSDGECVIDHPVRAQVPGLTFDPGTRRVLLREEGAAPVTCAKVVRHRWFPFRWESVDATGACVSRSEKRKVLVDDGYDGRQERHQVVFFGARR